MKEPFLLFNDASQFAMNAVLAQIHNGLERVICYASKSLNKAQSHYSPTKRELLPIVNYIRPFKHYLLGRRFKIITTIGSSSGSILSRIHTPLLLVGSEKLHTFILRLNTEVVKALEMPTVCDDSHSRQQPPFSTWLQPLTLTLR